MSKFILCTLPSASLSINGIDFETCPGGVVSVEPVEVEHELLRFTSIPGYELVDEKPGAEKPKPKAEPKPADPAAPKPRGRAAKPAAPVEDGKPADDAAAGDGAGEAASEGADAGDTEGAGDAAAPVDGDAG